MLAKMLLCVVFGMVVGAVLMLFWPGTASVIANISTPTQLKKTEVIWDYEIGVDDVIGVYTPPDEYWYEAAFQSTPVQPSGARSVPAVGPIVNTWIDLSTQRNDGESLSGGLLGYLMFVYTPDVEEGSTVRVLGQARVESPPGRLIYGLDEFADLPCHQAGSCVVGIAGVLVRVPGNIYHNIHQGDVVRSDSWEIQTILGYPGAGEDFIHFRDKPEAHSEVRSVLLRHVMMHGMCVTYDA